MKILIYFAVFVAIVSASLHQDADIHFHAFKEKHGKFYKNRAEEAKRFAAFQNSLRGIDEHNTLFEKGQTTWKKGITKFADWTDDEFDSTFNVQTSSTRKMTSVRQLEDVPWSSDLPDAIDWREEGQVTEVKDQGNCGAASFAFAVAGVTEASYYRKTGKLVSLSAQQIIDCSSKVGNIGCSSGHIRETFPYITWHGLQSEESYPYQGVSDLCQYNSSAVVTKITSFKYFIANSFATERVIGKIGPMAASFQTRGLKDYTSGIYQGEDCMNYDQNTAVLIVGYGSENGTDYWILKNSYGTNWGEDGYMRVWRNLGYDACHLDWETAYPIE